MQTANSIVNDDNSKRDLELTPASFWIASIIGPVIIGFLWAAITPPHGFRGLTAGVLIQLLMVSVFTDLSYRKIPNWATYTAFGWGMVINLLAYWMPDNASWLGAVGLGQSLAGGFGLLLIMFVIFSISGGGAGDVKLAACLGALLGWDIALNAMLYSFVFAGAGMLCVAIWLQGPWFITSAFFRSLGHLVLPTLILPPAERQRAMLNTKFPLGPFFAAGTLMALYMQGI